MDEIPKFEDTLPIEQASQPQDEAAPKFEDTQPMPENSEIPKFEDTQPVEKYETMGQQAGTFLEGTAQGFAGPLATYAEQKLSDLGVPNMTDEDIKGRQAANPGLHLAGEATGFGAGMFTGTGEAKVAATVAEHLAPQAFGKLGQMAINNAIQAGIFQGSDEISKALLGQGDPEHPISSAIANVGASGLFGLTVGAIGGAVYKGANKALQYLDSSKFAEKTNKFLYGMGLASSYAPEELEGFIKGMGKQSVDKATELGAKFFSALQNKAVDSTVGAITAQLLPGDSTPDKILKGIVGGLVGKKVAEKFGPVIYKILGSGVPDGVGQTMNYILKSKVGQGKIAQGVNQLFDYGAPKLFNAANPEDNQKLLEFIKSGGIENELKNQEPAMPQNFASGGEVTPPQEQSGLAAHFPDQNVMLNAAKARVSTYLKSQQPAPLHNKRAFDEDHKDVEQEHKYNRLLTLANQPLRILDHIKDGSLLPQHVIAMKSMYPELHGHLNKKLMEKIVEEAHEKRKPPYHVRQALSLFMGQDLDSSLTPQNIMAAQNVFARLNAQKQVVSAQKALPKMGENSVTPDQSRERRLNKA